MSYLNKNIYILIPLIFSFNLLYSQAIDIRHFADSDDWPLYIPGQVQMNNEKLTNLRIAYDAPEMGSPGGPTFDLYMDVMDIQFQGKPADWIQWTFSHKKEAEGKGPATMDMLIVEQETYKYLYRLHPNDFNTNANTYGTIEVRPNSVRQMTVKKKGTATLDTLAVKTPLFEFATLGFLFPFMDLEMGQKFRLKGYHFPSKSLNNMAVYVKGEVEIKDHWQKPHQAWAVEVLSGSKTTLVTYYVTKEAPYFYGWNYRRIEDGVSLFKMSYKGWLSTDFNFN